MAVKKLLASMLEENGGSSGWIEVNGIATNYLQAGEGPIEAIWFPAVGDTAWSFARTLVHLAKNLQGMATIKAIDPPSYGDTPLPDGVDMLGFEQLQQWATALVASASKPLVLVGNSSGGIVATLCAAAKMQQTKGLIYVAWPDWRFGTPPQTQLCPTTIAGMKELLALSWHRPPKLSEKVLQSLLEQVNQSRYSGHVNSLRLEEFNDCLDRFPGYIGFIGGVSDGLVQASVLKASAINHNAELFWIEDSGHYPHREQPRQLALTLIKAIKQLSQIKLVSN